MTRYLTVRCPSAPWENDTVESDRAWDLCYDLSVEFGYARILDGECIIGEYRDGRWTGTMGGSSSPLYRL
jgi:hypothetical protein